MERREFILLAGMGGLMASLGLLRYSTASFHDKVEKTIFDELHFLTLDKDGVKRFVRDYSGSMSSVNKTSLERYCFLGVSSDQSQKINRLINSYLLSSDFFVNGMDESRTIRYLGLYDPLSRPCANPFISVYYPGV